jgi:hypothetical protein
MRPGQEWSNISMVKTLLSAKDAKGREENQKTSLGFYFAYLRVLRGRKNHFKAASAAS